MPQVVCACFAPKRGWLPVMLSKGCCAQARLGDGLEAVAERARAQESGLNVLVVDASGGDPSQAMTCPPAAFLEREFLDDAHRSLAREGLLVVNCVCRSAPVFDSAVAALQVMPCAS